MWEPGFLTEALGSGEREVAGKLLGEEEPAPGSGSAPGCEAPQSSSYGCSRLGELGPSHLLYQFSSLS